MCPGKTMHIITIDRSINLKTSPPTKINLEVRLDLANNKNAAYIKNHRCITRNLKLVDIFVFGNLIAAALICYLLTYWKYVEKKDRAISNLSVALNT